MSKKRPGYDKDKKYKVGTTLTGEEMDMFFEGRQSRGIKSNSEYIRRLIKNDNTELTESDLIELVGLREKVVSLEKNINDLELEFKESEQGRQKWKSRHSNLEEDIENLKKNNAKWVYAFEILEMSILHQNSVKESWPGEDHLLSLIDGDRVSLLKQTLENDATVLEELNRQVESKDNEIMNTWVILGNLEDAIILKDIRNIHALPVTEENGRLGISQERKDAIEKSMNSLLANKKSLEKPTFGMALKMLWRSIFG